MTNTICEKQLKEYYDIALDLVIKCGPIFVEGYNKSKKEVMVKSDFYDFVTVYDRQIEEKLNKGLLEAFPESLFICEEALAGAKQLPELTDAPTWIIDPIDGTTNYIHRFPHSGISVALAMNKQLVVGIIYNPAANELFTSRKGFGSYLNGEPIQVSGATAVGIVEQCNLFSARISIYSFSYLARWLDMKLLLLMRLPGGIRPLSGFHFFLPILLLCGIDTCLFKDKDFYL